MASFFGFIFWVGVAVFGYNVYQESQQDNIVIQAREKYGDKYPQRQKEVIENSIILQMNDKDGDYILIKNMDIIPLECELKICVENECASTAISVKNRDEESFPSISGRAQNKRGMTYELIYQGESLKRLVWE